MSTFTCPSCGGSLPSSGARCRRCGPRARSGGGMAVGPVAAVTAMASSGTAPARFCPGCRRPAAGRVVRCFYCGHDLPPLERPPGRSCPRCRVDLQAITATWVSVDVCPRCAGVFYDRGELEREQRAGSERFRWLQAQLRPCADSMNGMLGCPGCLQQMVAVTPGGDPPLVLDACPRCKGWWLDAGELQALHQIALRGTPRRQPVAANAPWVPLDPDVQELLAQQAEERRKQRRAHDEAARERQRRRQQTSSFNRPSERQLRADAVADAVDLVGDVLGWFLDP